MSFEQKNKVVLYEKEWARVKKRAIACKDHVCALCQKPIDMNAPPFHPLALEVDHIVPKARGGALYELDNLQLTHSKCNRSKGVKMDSDYPDRTVVNQVPISNPW